MKRINNEMAHAVRQYRVGPGNSIPPDQSLLFIVPQIPLMRMVHIFKYSAFVVIKKASIIWTRMLLRSLIC